MESQLLFADARILVVDDEESNVNLLVRALRQAGYLNVEGITDPRRALTLCAEEPEPDLLLLDLLMPNIDGFAILKILRGHRRVSSYLPVLVLTADATVESKR